MPFLVICDRCKKKLGIAKTEAEAEAKLRKHRMTSEHQAKNPYGFKFNVKVPKLF